MFPLLLWDKDIEVALHTRGNIYVLSFYFYFHLLTVIDITRNVSWGTLSRSDTRKHLLYFID